MVYESSCRLTGSPAGNVSAGLPVLQADSASSKTTRMAAIAGDQEVRVIFTG